MRRRTPDNQTNKWYKLHIVLFNLLNQILKTQKLWILKSLLTW